MNTRHQKFHSNTQSISSPFLSTELKGFAQRQILVSSKPGLEVGAVHLSLLSHWILALSSPDVEIGLITANTSELFALFEPALEFLLEQEKFASVLCLDLATVSFG